MKLNVHVYNERKETTSCKIKLCHDNNKATVYCSGEYEFELAPGEYSLEIYKGNLFMPVKEKVEIDERDIAIEVCLKEMIDTKSLGLYSFDAHSHVSRNKKSTAGNLEHASTIMKGEDFNFLFAGSPYDLETHIQDTDNSYVNQVPYREKYAEIIEAVNNNNSSFILDIGNEIVKVRYGHMFLMNYDQTPPYSKHYDRAWDPWLFTKVGEEPAYDISYPYEALGKERGRNSVAVAAHPTSWWHHNGEFISNIASTLGFEILAGSIDAMVIMGYDSDHRHYQELWYEVLNHGYFMPGVAEMDLTFDSTQMKYLKFKTYSYLDDFSIDSLCASVKAGRNIVSSGPIIQLHVNGQKPGAVLNYVEDEEFNIEIEAFQCYQASLSKIQLIVNGKVWIEHEVNDSHYVQMEKLKINRDSYVLAKCYDFAGNVAITNPVYVRNASFENKNFKSELTVSVIKDGKPTDGLFWIDDDQDKLNFSNEIHCKIKVASEVSIEVDGVVKKVKLFELDELQKIFKNLYFGYWNSNNQYAPGEVPASYFELARIKKILSKVELQISF